MVTNASRKACKKHAFSIFCAFLLMTNGMAQLNLSQTPHGLDFRPVTSGKLTFWETSSHPSDSGFTILSVYDGKRNTILDKAIYGMNYEVQVSGDNALFKRYYNNNGLYYYKDGTVLPLGESFSKPWNTTALISGNQAVWVKTNGVELGYYNGSVITELGITPFDNRKKTLLSLIGKNLTYQTEDGDYILLHWEIAPLGPTSLITNGDASLVKLNSHPNPTGLATQGTKLTWVEFDGNDNEIFYYGGEFNGSTSQQLTNNTIDDNNPVVTPSGKVAWLGEGEVNFFQNGQVTTLITDQAEKAQPQFSGELLTWQQKISGLSVGYDLYCYNGTSIFKLNDEPVASLYSYEPTASSEKYIAWPEDSSVRFFDGTTTGEIRLTDFRDIRVSGSTLVWVKGYGDDVYQYDMEKGDVSNFKIENTTFGKCQRADEFYVSFSSKDSLPQGVIGLDFSIRYDTALYYPTGNFLLYASPLTYTKAAVNGALAGELFVSIYLNGAPEGTYINGKGKLIRVELAQKKPGQNNFSYLTTGQVELSYVNGSFKSYPADTGYIKKSQEITGQLIYLEDYTNKIIYDPSNATSYLPTFISFSVNSYCRPPLTATATPDLNGAFVIPAAPVNISFSRDIPGDTAISGTDVMPVINSADRNQALAIANYSYSNPTVFELIAADVNLDGKVSSGDVSLISSRTINIYNEFPQQGNYIWSGSKYVPSPSYTRSKDWLFIDSLGLTYLKSQKSDRDHVPTIPNCLPLYSFIAGNSCLLSYTGILLGDVARSWQTINGQTLRTAEMGKVVMDFLHPTVLGENQYRIPIQIMAPGKVSGFDFTLHYDSSIFLVSGVVKNEKYANLGLEYNDILSKELKVASYDDQGFTAGETVMYIQLRAKDPFLLNTGVLKVVAYINGEAVPVENGIITAMDAKTEAGSIRITPNPTSGMVLVQSEKISGPVKIEVLNFSGDLQKSFVSTSDDNSFKKEVDLSDLMPGAYLLKITGNNTVLIEKLVKL
jgi:hypothetical protein